MLGPVPVVRVRRPWVILLAVVAAAAVAVTFFLTRPQVLIVTDDSFEAVYGPSRGDLSRGLLSLRLLRPVRRLPISDASSSSAVALAVAAAWDSRRTLCVIFPSYLEEAAGAAAARGVVPVVVAYSLSSDSGVPPPPGVIPVRPDPRSEGYRIGRLAASLSSSGGEGAAAKAGRILVRARLGWSGPFLTGVAEGASGAGLRSDPVLVDPAEKPAPLPGDFLVDAAPESSRPVGDTLAGLPQILYSWIDPRLLPANVRYVDDDSLYALAVGAVRAAREGRAAAVDSRLFSPRGLGKFLY